MQYNLYLPPSVLAKTTSLTNTGNLRDETILRKKINSANISEQPPAELNLLLQ